jgi:SAM-dependent MidA family methyltransferase
MASTRSWATYMQEALYDPVNGFFATSPVGKAFATAPHVSPVFAACIARLLEVTPGDSLLEIACSDGTLASQIAASAPALASRTTYIGVDQDQQALRLFSQRSALAFKSVRLEPSLDTVEPIEGLIFANELFDNVPFERLRCTPNGELVEVHLDASGKVTEVAASKETMQAASRLPEPGQERTSSPQAVELMRALTDRLHAGSIVIIDYGFTGDETAEPVRGYRNHERVDPETEPPGSCDITGPVDIDALAVVGKSAGLQVRQMRQSAFLQELGFASFLEQLDAQRQEAEAKGDHRYALRIWEARRDATLLVDPSHMGSFHVLWMTR